MTTTRPLPLPDAAPSNGTMRAIAFVFAAGSIAAMLVSSSALTPFYPHLERALEVTPLGISLVFAIYAIMLLAALLVAGSLTDHVGRRGVISGSLVALALGALLVASVDSTGALFAARALQGTASGLLTPALSALLLDTARADRAGRGALLNAVTPGIGLALGALIGGGALSLIDRALPATFHALALVYVALACAVWLLPETSPRRQGTLRSLIPRVSVPRSARRMFLISVPALMASWSTGGLFLSLGPSIIIERLHNDSPFVQGAIVAILPAAGAVAVILLRRASPRLIAIAGATALALGTISALGALFTDSLLGYIAAVAVTGAGFGASFYGVVGTLSATAPAHERAGMFASIYVVSYLSFGVPTVAAGFLASATSITLASTLYGILVIALASTAAVARLRARD